MSIKKSLTLVALAASLSVGVTACGNDDTSSSPDTSASSNGGTTAKDAEATTPTDFADDEARAALGDLCSRISLDQTAALLEVPAVELRDGISKADDSADGTYGNEGSGNAYCAFMEPGADEYGSTSWDGSQTFASISVAGPAVEPCEGCSGGTVDFADGSIGYYDGTDGTVLYVTPHGSPYEYSFSVVMPYEATTASGLDRETTDKWRAKAAEVAHAALG